MNKEEYQVLYNVENDYWWYVGLRKLILSFLDLIFEREGELRILDAGCGTGKMLDTCRAHDMYGIDFSIEAMRFCRLRKLNKVARSSICSIPFKESSFDVVISLDVLYHKGVASDELALKEIHSVLNKNGTVILNLPAYDFLHSSHDVAVHTRSRYTKKHLREEIEKAGFEVEKLTYRNSILLPIVFIKRIIERVRRVDYEETGSELKPLPFMVNKLFTMLLLIENKLIEMGVNFPAGLSLYCIARKKS